MARTAPVPDIPPIPGMNPGVIVAGGGGGGPGDGDGSGSDGDGSAGADGENGGENAGSDGNGAGHCGAGAGAGTCPTHSAHAAAGDPVDVMTGHVYTVPKTDLYLPGFFNLAIDRSYDTRRRDRDCGMGWGWVHSLAWELRIEGRNMVVRDGAGRTVEMRAPLEPGEQVESGPWTVIRVDDGYVLRPGSEFRHVFCPQPDDPALYRLAAIAYRNQGQISLEYEDGRLVRAIDTAGRTVHFGRGSNGRIVALAVQPLSGRRQVFATYEYDQGGFLVGAADADGHRWRYRYDDDRRLIEMELPTGLRFHWSYDRQGRCVETWAAPPGTGRDPALIPNAPTVLADGRTRAKGILHSTFEYGRGYTEVTDSVRLMRYFGSAGGVTKSVSAAGGVTTRTLDADGNEIERTDANGAVTRFQYDALGKLTCETDPLGNSVFMSYDSEGRHVEVIDPAGGRVRSRYDADGHLESLEHQNGAVETFRYDAHGQLVERVDPRGGRWTFEYDAQGNCIRRTLPTGGRYEFEYDDWGRIVRERLPGGSEFVCTYSNRGDLIRITDALGRIKTIDYDGIQNPIAVTLPDGSTSRIEWGGLGWKSAFVHPGGDRIEWRYNAEGWVITERNEAGEVDTFHYDRTGRVVGEEMYNGRKIRFSRDRMGWVVWRDDGSGKTEIVRDAIGRPVEMIPANGSPVRYEYNARGELIAARSADVALEWLRDAVGGISREIQIVDGTRYVVDSTRDVAGARTAMATSLGFDLRVVRDAQGDVTELHDRGQFVTQFDRDGGGWPLRRVLGGGAAITDTLDAAGRLLHREVIGPGTTLRDEAQEPQWVGRRDTGAISKAYAYTPVDEVAEVTTTADGTTEYAYDLRRRLVRKRRPDASEETWATDAIDDYFDRTPGAGSRSYLPGGRIRTDGATKYEYDERGFLVEKERLAGEKVERWRYAWNAWDRLEAVERPNGTRVEFKYDAFARRVAKRVVRPKVGAEDDVLSTTHFVWDLMSMVHEVHLRRGAPAETQSYLYEENDQVTPIGHWSPSDGWVHYVGDLNETPEELVDPSGRSIGKLERSTFGAARPAPGSRVTTPVRAPGQYADEETGLHYNRYRYYDPETGHYISPDPIGIEGGTNLYAFGPNPVGWFDPIGWQHVMNAVVTTSGRPPKQLARGAYQSGMGDDCPDDLRNRASCHTERKFLHDLATVRPQSALRGAQARCFGQFPPCPNCHRAMRAAADKTGATITYQYRDGAGNPQSITYRPDQAPAPSGESAKRLTKAYAMTKDAEGKYRYDDFNRARTTYGQGRDASRSYWNRSTSPNAPGWNP